MRGRGQRAVLNAAATLAAAIALAQVAAGSTAVAPQMRCAGYPYPRIPAPDAAARRIATSSRTSSAEVGRVQQERQRHFEHLGHFARIGRGDVVRGRSVATTGNTRKPVIVHERIEEAQRRDLRGGAGRSPRGFAHRGGDRIAVVRLRCGRRENSPARHGGASASVRRVSSTCVPSGRGPGRPAPRLRAGDGIGQQVGQFGMVPAVPGRRCAPADAGPRADAARSAGRGSHSRRDSRARQARFPSAAGARRRSSATSARSRRWCGGSLAQAVVVEAADADAGTEDGAEGRMVIAATLRDSWGRQTHCAGDVAGAMRIT